MGAVELREAFGVRAVYRRPDSLQWGSRAGYPMAANQTPYRASIQQMEKTMKTQTQTLFNSPKIPLRVGWFLLIPLLALDLPIQATGPEIIIQSTGETNADHGLPVWSRSTERRTCAR
jgi:hypothetical protein